MTTVLTSLHLQLQAGNGVPEWVHPLPAGTFSGADGRGPYALDNPEAVIRQSMAAGKLAIDENHAIDLAGKQGLASPARGWIVELEQRQDGLWGKVEWTGAGRALMEDHAYRGISPVFMSEQESGRVLRVLRAALTNDPNLTLTTLHASSRSDDMTFLDKVRRALGLADNATEDAAIAAITAHAAAGAQIAEAAGLAKDAKPDAVVTVLQARAAEAEKIAPLKASLKAAGLDFATATPAQIQTHLQAAGGGDAAMKQTVIELQTQLSTLQAQAALEKATTFVDAQIKAGKPIKPLRDHYIARHQKDPAGVETELNALVSINAGGTVTPPKDPNAKGADSLDDQEREVCALMGIDPAKYAESKAQIAIRFG